MHPHVSRHWAFSCVNVISVDDGLLFVSVMVFTEECGKSPGPEQELKETVHFLSN